MAAVDRTLQAREEALSMLKFHYKRAQDRMKSLADKHRIDREFSIGTWVYLKLQPHRQVTLRTHKQHKLSAKFYGPFQVIERIGKVAYRLQLPSEAQVHPVFHISQLKLCRGSHDQAGTLPPLDSSGTVTAVPIAILDRQLSRRGNSPVMMVLVQWSNGTERDATWEVYGDLIAKFPTATCIFGDKNV